MSQIPPCPQCNSEYVYQDGELFICPECGFEWNQNDVADELVVLDANGARLSDGDSVVVIKDRKVKGTSSIIKVGTKIKNIRLIESTNNHPIDCKIDGIGQIKLCADFVKKA